MSCLTTHILIETYLFFKTASPRVSFFSFSFLSFLSLSPSLTFYSKLFNSSLNLCNSTLVFLCYSFQFYLSFFTSPCSSLSFFLLLSLFEIIRFVRIVLINHCQTTEQILKVYTNIGRNMKKLKLNSKFH